MMHSHSQRALPYNELAQMSFLLKHLEQKWSIKKRNNSYILKKVNGSKMTYTSSYLDTYLTAPLTATHSLEIKQIQLLTFLHNALEDGWNIKKHDKQANVNDPNKYVFIKKHNGQCEIYEDDEYLTKFIKSKLQLQSS